MNKYIITAREIERMLNLAAMEEAGCLSRAGKEELNELVARVQEVIDELAAWWKEIKRIKEEIKAKNAEAKNKGEKTDSVPRLDYSPQEHAATYWLRPIIDKGVGGMTLVVADGWVDQMRRIGFTMNGVELSVCRFEQYAKLMEKAWNNGKQARRMIHNGGTCDCVMPLEFVKRQKGAEEGECDQDSPIGEGGSQKRNQVKEEYEYKEEGEDKQQKSLLTKCANRDTCHESFADLCEETYCKLNRSLSVHEADNLQYVQSVLRTLGGEWLRWIRKSKGIPVRPDLLAKSIKCDDPRLVPIIRFFAHYVDSTEPLGERILLDKLCTVLVQDNNWLEAVRVWGDDSDGVRAAALACIRELRKNDVFNKKIWNRLDICRKAKVCVDKKNEDGTGLANEHLLFVDVLYPGDDEYMKSEAPEPIVELMRATYVGALLKRAGMKESRKRAFVAAIEAVMGAGEESRQEALLLWDQAKADKERTKELEAYWKKWEQEVEKEKELRKAKRARRGSRAKRAARA